jgi:hypothetical protein
VLELPRECESALTPRGGCDCENDYENEYENENENEYENEYEKHNIGVEVDARRAGILV